MRAGIQISRAHVAPRPFLPSRLCFSPRGEIDPCFVSNLHHFSWIWAALSASSFFFVLRVFYYFKVKVRVEWVIQSVRIKIYGRKEGRKRF